MIYMALAYYSYGYGYDPTWFLLIITGIIAIVAQIRVSSSFSKYSKVQSRTGLTGAEAAERILHSKGIYDVRIQHIAGSLTDNYNRRTRHSTYLTQLTIHVLLRR